MRKYLLTTIVSSLGFGLMGCSDSVAEAPPVLSIGAMSAGPSASVSASTSAPATTVAPTMTTSAPPAPTMLPSATTEPTATMTPPPALGGTTEPTMTPPPALDPNPPAATMDPVPTQTMDPVEPAPTMTATATTTTPTTADNPFDPSGPFDPPGASTPEPTMTATTDPPPGGGSTEVDCDAAMPSGGTAHPSNNASGKAGGLDWTIWSNGTGGSITTFDVPAFTATWNNSGDLLARLGVQWDNSKTYDQYGTITAQFASKKTGTGGQYSYVGIYGWSTNPCVEYYIIDDSFNPMPVNPGNTTNKGEAMIDGGTYVFYTRDTQGTGGSKCSGVNNWVQFYSVRKTARACGEISITQHFDAWAAAGMTLGKMDQAQILIEVGGGTGSIDFSTASVTVSP